MGARSRELVGSCPAVTTTYQAVLGVGVVVWPITVVLVALPELSAVSAFSPMTFWVD